MFAKNRRQWMGSVWAITACACLASALICAGAAIAQPGRTPSQLPEADLAYAGTLASQLRDDYVGRIASAGLKCLIAPPTIRVEHVFSYGSYDEDANTLSTSAWELLTGEEKARFFRLAGPQATPEKARNEFEIGVHHWVLSHEMGHWWQACQHQQNERHYAFELEANRLATAY